MKLMNSLSFISALLLAGFAVAQPARAQSPAELIQESVKAVSLPAGFKYEVLVQGDIPEPLELDFCPDGRLWFTGRRGNIWAYDFKTKTKSEIAHLDVDWKPIPGRESNERGLHGIEFDPDYSRNGFVYLHYAVVYTQQIHSNRLARFTVDNPARATGLIPQSEKILLEYVSIRGFHQGGPIEYNPFDKKLYLTAGDNNVSTDTQKFWDDPNNGPQRLDELRGKTLRLNLDGSIPSDNPFVHTPGARGEIYTYGHRNPYTMNIDYKTGRVYVGEVGYDRAIDFEEINELEAGGNYGWPRLMGTNVNTFATDKPNPYPNAIRPWLCYIHDRGANVVSGPFYRANQGRYAFPKQWQDGMFYADFTRKWIRFAPADPQTNVSTKNVPFARGFTGGILSMKMGPDGAIYFTEYAGWFTGTPKDKVSRIVWVGK